MKTKHLLAIACVALIGQQAYAQQAELRPRSVVDSTRTARLIGTLQQPPSASELNSMITNQASAASASWTKSFLGEQKCVYDPWPGIRNTGAQTLCALIQSDGTIAVLEAVYPNASIAIYGQHWVNLGVPDAYMTLASSQLVVIPSFTNTDKRDGKLPPSWRIQLRAPEEGVPCETPCLYGTN